MAANDRVTADELAAVKPLAEGLWSLASLETTTAQRARKVAYRELHERRATRLQLSANLLHRLAAEVATLTAERDALRDKARTLLASQDAPDFGTYVEACQALRAEVDKP